MNAPKLLFGFLVLISLVYSNSNAECINTGRHLKADELESIGIHVAANKSQSDNLYDLSIRIQPEICVKTDEKNCSSAAYTIFSVELLNEEKSRSLEWQKPNQYEYIANLSLTANELVHATVEAIYRGEPCDANQFRQQRFIFKLSDIPLNNR